ncbi:MAG: hypothetical protein LC749_06250, partial [Actinobacteria bacterium]|nr:hypothetical protein [Actinomycetota bacterium]
MRHRGSEFVYATFRLVDFRALPDAGSRRELEYGAGTGLVSQALRDTVGPITMADVWPLGGDDDEGGVDVGHIG